MKEDKWLRLWVVGILVLSLGFACEKEDEDPGQPDVLDISADGKGDAAICTPDCEGKECGDDGCDGDCGSCPEAAPTCKEGKCVVDCEPDCAQKECGDDGCGGDCGECDDGLGCTEDKCQEGQCSVELQQFFCLVEGICVPSGTKAPANLCTECLPNTATDGWTAAEDGTPCGGTKICFQGACCDGAANCGDRECGADGCGGTCGECPDGLPICDEDSGVCISDCVPSCDGNECGDDGCGTACGECVKGYECAAIDEGTECLAQCGALCEGKACGVAGVSGECECGTCFDDHLCTDDECVDGACAYVDNNVECDDGNPCTGNDMCQGGSCQGDLLPPEQLVVEECLCLSDEDCEELEDGDVCNGTLECNGAAIPPVCQVVQGSILECDDGNPCTENACDPDNGCVFAADNDADCSDENVCNGLETCSNGNCLPGQPLECDDANPCMDDSCDQQQGCLNVPNDQNSCQDDDVCNGDEYCDGGGCMSGAPLVCSDNNICTLDLCAADTGCEFPSNESACDDGLVCTDDGCGNNECTNAIQAFFCVVDKTCVPSGTVDPADACSQCQPNSSQTGWTELPDGTPCGAGSVCFGGACCKKSLNCAGKDCGDDGCGGICGGCPKSFFCNDGNCEEDPCEPSCAGKECGPDGCSDTCGDCLANEFCTVQGICICLPDCVGKFCGSDGCGELCGECPEKHTCQAGECVEDPCQPQCVGKECGDDACGDVCGACEQDEACVDGSCQQLGGPDSCLGHCGGPSTDCYCDDLCFAFGSCCTDVCAACPDLQPCKCGDGQCQNFEACDTCPDDCGCEAPETCDGGECACPQGNAICDGLCCAPGEVCTQGACCEPSCAGKACGSDGCGGGCGDCTALDQLFCASAVCVNNQCELTVGTFFCVVEGTCVPSGTENPEKPCEKCQPLKSQVDWSSVENEIPCGNGLACHNGVCCNFDCYAKQCGSDGCGDVCGICPDTVECFEDICSICDDGNDVDWDGCTDGALSEFLVHTTTYADQLAPRMGTFADGSFALVWQSDQQDGDGQGIFARYFDPQGWPMGAEIGVTTTTKNAQQWPDIGVHADGRHMITWSSWQQDGDGWGVYGRLFDKDGVPTSGEIKLNGSTAGDQSASRVAALDNGVGYVVVWNHKGGKWADARAFDMSGEPLGPTVTSKQGTALNSGPAVAALGPDKFVVTWEAKNPNYRDVMIQLWKIDGTKITDAFVGAEYSQYDQTKTQPARLADGGFIVVWQGYDDSNQGIRYRAFDADGEPSSDEFLANLFTTGSQTQGSIAVLPTGDFVITWSGTGDAVGDYIWFRIFAGPGQPITGEIMANVYTDDTQTGAVVGPLVDGSFLLSWMSRFQDGGSWGVYGQRFDKFGNKLYN